MSLWKKIGGKDWVNKMLNKLLAKVEPDIVGILVKNGMTLLAAEKATKEILDAGRKAIDHIW